MLALTGMVAAPCCLLAFNPAGEAALRRPCWGRRAEHRCVTSSSLQALIALGDSKIFSNITWMLCVN